MLVFREVLAVQVAVSKNMRCRMGPPVRKLNMFEPAVFHIRVQGELSESWSAYFGARSVHSEEDADGNIVTVIVTEPVDQGGLVGMVNHLNALGLPLISVTCERGKDVAHRSLQ
jgi:hypothetical protein